MAELKYGGSNVKIMYGSQEIGGTTKLEPGTIFYFGEPISEDIKNLHLFNTTKNWSNINGINVKIYSTDYFRFLDGLDIVGDDFKNLDIEKKYTLNDREITVSRSIVDGEYRLNVSIIKGFHYVYSVRAI